MSAIRPPSTSSKKRSMFGIIAFVTWISLGASVAHASQESGQEQSVTKNPHYVTALVTFPWNAKDKDIPGLPAGSVVFDSDTRRESKIEKLSPRIPLNKVQRRFSLVLIKNSEFAAYSERLIARKDGFDIDFYGNKVPVFYTSTSRHEQYTSKDRTLLVPQDEYFGELWGEILKNGSLNAEQLRKLSSEHAERPPRTSSELKHLGLAKGRSGDRQTFLDHYKRDKTTARYLKGRQRSRRLTTRRK